jgi:hypothetical protein
MRVAARRNWQINEQSVGRFLPIILLKKMKKEKGL